MSFDWSMRRLITGAHDGSVRMWNFSNGMMLKEFLRGEGTDDDDQNNDKDSDKQPFNTMQSIEKQLVHDNETEVTSVKYILERGGGGEINYIKWDEAVMRK